MRGALRPGSGGPGETSRHLSEDSRLGSTVRVFQVLVLVLLTACQAEQPRQAVVAPAGFEGLDPAIQEHFQQLVTALEHGDTAAGLARTGAEIDHQVEAWGELGAWFHRYGFEEGARDAYGKAISLIPGEPTPGEPKWRYYLAHLQRDSGQLAEARAGFRSVAEQDASNLAAVVWSAEMARLMGDDAAAVRGFEQALEIAPSCAMAHAGLGTIAQQQGDLETARGHFESALAIQPDVAAVLYALAQVVRGLGEEQRAHELLARVPSDNREQVRIRLRDPWMQALLEDRRGVQSLLEAARAARRARQFSDALSLARQAVLADAEAVSARLLLAQILADSRRLPAAIRELEAAHQHFPADQRIAYHLGSFRGAAGDLEGAEAILRHVISRDAQDADAHLALGQVLSRATRCAEAIESFGAAWQERPSLAAAQGGIRCRIELGQWREAAEAWEDARAMWPDAPALEALGAELESRVPSSSH